MTAPSFDIPKLKTQVTSMWRQGGENTLVKVMPKGQHPDDARMTGYCTTIKYVAGRTPAQMEDILGFRQGTKLAGGAAIFLVSPLPAPDQFAFRSYSTLPAGVAQIDGKVLDKDYPPGLGAPQWELDRYPQSGLHWLQTVLPGETFVIRYAVLPANPPVFISNTKAR